MSGPLLTASEVAEILRVSQARVYELARTGRLGGAVRLGRQLRIERNAFELWLANGGTRPGSASGETNAAAKR